MTLVLGLTGGIASGKSTADRFFSQNQVPLIDSDQIAHDLLNVGAAGYAAVVEQFGPAIVNSDQSINRAKLGQLVFAKPAQREVLNNITHPLIFREIQTKITQNRQAKVPLVVFDAPLLFESGGQKYCDRTLLIALPAQLQLERLMARDRLSRQAALERIHSQMSLAQKAKLADYVIANTGTIEELESKLKKLLGELKKED
ncbi:dephospho-CoA kinase [Lactobacillus xylocopicola]|uniref:Dephospho-CoA kinase n=1 Tax=Lactobacillus xylocopicola TaxID=2976676 RepID=A0ABM8BHH0_9LACO|nr:dephospho-CoA kinase [Lactobacillus xylocopicola]BDR60747.1 dephospho-CoA kinase [Lactobacillus xylocopicola]